MSTTECPHGDDPSICPPCQPMPARKGSVVIARIASAVFPGRCLVCDNAINEGDAIVLTWDGPPWTHEGCA